jgi:putative hemolysin
MTETAIIVFTLVASGFFSGTEIAFITANRLRLEVFERKGVFGAKLANFFIRNLDKTLTTTLVGHNIVTIIFSSMMGGIFALVWGRGSLFLDTAVIALILLIAAEIIPKLFFRELADYAVLIASPILRGLYVILFPVIWLAEKLANRIARLFGQTNADVSEFFRKQDFEILLREHSRGSTEVQKDVEIISNVLSISDIRVKESMVPRTEIVAIESGTPMKDVVQRFQQLGYSRMPVYEESIDKIIGIVSVRDLFSKPKSLQAITREAVFVPETKKSVELLGEFLRNSQSLAIVVDEFGGTAGMVTAEDLIEELVGDIQDEYDTEDEVCRVLSENTYLISGRVEIDTLEEKFGLKIPKEDYETLAGYILNRVGRIPEQGEMLTIDNFLITISKATKTKVDIVKLQKNP